MFSRFNTFILSLCLILGLLGCATTHYGKGFDPQGAKVYLGATPIENTLAFQTYKKTAGREVDKQKYLFDRLKASVGLEFYHDGSWYNALMAYRGGLWLVRNRYKAGQDSRGFIQKYVERSDAGNFHLVKYPDGSVQIGSYVLLNELDLLEAAKKSS